MLTRAQLIAVLLLFPVCSLAAHESDLIPFSFTKKSLLTLIEELAAKKNLNVVIPTVPDNTADGSLEALKKQNVTYQPHEQSRIPLEHAWNILQTMVELSGFSLIQKKDTLFVKKALGAQGATATRDILPLYVDINPLALPNSSERIRYLYFPRNLRIPSLQETGANPFTKVLTDLLSKDATIVYNPRSNGILLADKATHIRSALTLLTTFDAAGEQESLLYVPLTYTSAADVTRILDSLKKAAGEEQDQFSFMPRVEMHTHFAAATRIIANERNNGIILIGPEANITYIADFIRRSIDQEPEKGKSILQVYDLQYLDAQTFAPQLQKIVTSFISAGTQAAQQTQEGTERQFRGVQVIAEPETKNEKDVTQAEATLDQKGALAAQGLEGVTASGGNRLLIAALQDDWKFIKSLIKQLDVPQYQVVLEMYLVDFTYDHKTAIEGDSRSFNHYLPSGVQYLSSNITDVSTVLGNTPTQLAQDLLQVVGPGRFTDSLNTGSALISFNDPQTPGIAGLLLFLESILKAKVLTTPYLFVTNHKKGSIESQNIRRINGDIVTVSNGSYTIPIEDVAATLKVEAIPHILTEEKVRLELILTVEQFIGSTFNRQTRSIQTTSTLRNGQILAMGGIVQDSKIEVETNTPFFARIPLIGWFFKGRSYEDARVNITLFVSPTIIEPRKRSCLTEKTYSRICLSDEPNSQEFFDKTDPIARVFLRQSNNDLFNRYMNDSCNLHGLTLEDCKKSINLLDQRSCTKPKKTFNSQELKELLTHNPNPLLGVKKRKR